MSKFKEGAIIFSYIIIFCLLISIAMVLFLAAFNIAIIIIIVGSSIIGSYTLVRYLIKLIFHGRKR